MGREDVVSVSIERLTRFYLLNHCLLHKMEKCDLLESIGIVCGLHAQLPLTPHCSLWNRVEDFKPEMLNEALYREKSLVKTWFMRGTLHIIPSKDLPTYYHALKRMWFEHHGRYMNKPDWPSRQLREKTIYPRITEALAERPLRRKELSNKARQLIGDFAQPYEKLFSAWGGILKETSYLGLTVHAEPCGRESCFARLDQWLPSIDLDKTDEVHARADLLRKYLQCYGPASAQDFACWSGLLTSEAANITNTVTDILTEVKVEETGQTLWMLRKDLKSLLELDLGEDVPPRLLPKYDSYLLGHKDRARIISPQHLHKVYRPVVGEVAATLLINGRIVAAWEQKKTKKTLTISVRPFETVSKEMLRKVEAIANELGRFLNVEQTKIQTTNP